MFFVQKFICLQTIVFLVQIVIGNNKAGFWRLQCQLSCVELPQCQRRHKPHQPPPPPPFLSTFLTLLQSHKPISFDIPHYNASRPTTQPTSFDIPYNASRHKTHFWDPSLQCHLSHKPISFRSLPTMPTVPQTHFCPRFLPTNASCPTNPFSRSLPTMPAAPQTHFFSDPFLECQPSHKPISF